VTSVFGRQGAVVSHTGDYTTDQVMEGGKLYFTDQRAQAAVNWNILAGKPSTFAPTPHAAAHRNGGSDEIATAAPTPHGIPKADSDGKLDAGWLPAGSGALGYTAENVANKGQANGYASLGSDGKVPSAQLPAAGAGVNSLVLTLDGSNTSLADGSTITWSTVGNQRQTNWTVPAGVNWIWVEVWGAGGGGNGSSGQYGGDGGGGGGFATRRCAVMPGASLAISVGIGGVGANYGASTGGGSSSVGTCVTVTGGGGSNANIGGGISTISPPGYGYQNSGTGMLSPATILIPNGTTANAIRPDLGGAGAGRQTASGPGIAGGASVCGGGGGGGGAYTNATGGSGGASGCGGTGGAGGAYVSPTYTACAAGTAPGGGGGGAGLEGNGGGAHKGCAGARGEVRVYYTK
jgi:hypothetical protein